jgi:hypothetical protein
MAFAAPSFISDLVLGGRKHRGGALGMAPGMYISETIAPVILVPNPSLLGEVWQYAAMAAFFGLALGTARWWRLRQVALFAGWWPIANWLGWSVGMGSGTASTSILASTVDIVDFF